MIYEYLLPPCDVYIEATDFLPANAANSSRPQLIDCPHILQSGFSDAVTQHELVEAWYKFCTFQFEGNNLVSKFLHEDLWGLSLPVRQLVRRLEIEVWEQDCLSRLKYLRVPNSDHPDLLDCLRAIRPGVRLVFPINTDSRSVIWVRKAETVNEFVTLFSQFFPSVRRLLAAGHEVIVELDGELTVRIKEEDLTQAVWHGILRDRLKVLKINYFRPGIR